jgi:cysteine desulfurase
MAATSVYFDNLATTPVDPRVVEAMLPYFTKHFGNAASKSHGFGWKAAEAVEQSRSQVARLLGAASPQEIIFTSGGTEANNLALKGVAEYYRREGNHIVTCAIEHKSVLDCCRSLEDRGYQITYLLVDGYGRVDMDRLRALVSDQTILISVMAANNEIGTIQPLKEIGVFAKEQGILWHCDAVQAAGKIPLNVQDLGVDLLALSAHKIYGPKGVGALYIRSRRPRVRLKPQIEGGGHERGLRSGTLDVPGIVGLGKACELCGQELEVEADRLKSLRQQLYLGIAQQLEDVQLNGHPRDRLPGNLHLSFPGVDGAGLLLALEEIALSAGSACSSASGEPSHVLKAVGLEDDMAFSSVRFGLGRFNQAGEIDYVIGRVTEEVNRLRVVSF